MVSLPSPAQVVPSDNILIQWNKALLDAIRIETTSPPLAARNLAMMHIAIYEAINAVDPRFKSYLSSGTDVPKPISLNGAAAAAAFHVASYLYPSSRAQFQRLFDQILKDKVSESAANGVSWGNQVAQKIIALRAGDGASTIVPYIPCSEVGAWRRTSPYFRPPELPQWRYVRPFAMTNSAQFRPPGPPATNSERYAEDFNLVKELGRIDSLTRTAAQTEIARFWSDFSYTSTPPGHWNEIAQNVVAAQGCSIEGCARLFALLNIALADAAIAAWDAKYEFDTWRPITAIQRGDQDTNPKTKGDTKWRPLLTTPAFPEYVSGHSTFSAAAAVILSSFFGTDQISFSVGCDSLPNVVRHYSSFSQAVIEIGMSRIYGGIHFPFADFDGQKCGRKLGDYVIQNFLTPLPH